MPDTDSAVTLPDRDFRAKYAALAQQALAQLRRDNPDLATSVEKILPGYAVRRAQQDPAIDVEALITAALQGAAALKASFNPTAAPAGFLARYRKILEQKAGETPYQFPVVLATRDNDIAGVEKIIAESGGFAVGRDDALMVAARKGHTEIARMLVDHDAHATMRYPRATREAALNGHADILALLLEKKPQSQDGIDYLLRWAAMSGTADTLEVLLRLGADPTHDNHAIVIEAARRNNAAALRICLSQDVPMDVKSKALFTASAFGAIDAVNALLDHGVKVLPTEETDKSPLISAARSGHADVVALFIARDDGAARHIDAALSIATFNGRFDTVAYLLEHVDQAAKDRCLKNALFAGDGRLADLAIACGADAQQAEGDRRAILDVWRRQRGKWQAALRMDPPEWLAACDPAPFKPLIFNAVLTALNEEGYGGTTAAHAYAYNAVALFQSEDRILRYLQTHGEDVKTPLHDLLQAIQLPEDLGGADLSAWGDAVLKHGPQMAKLAKFCDRLPQPQMSADGRTWSYAATRMAVAQFAYARASEHPELAALCFAHTVDEEAFNAALDVVTKTPQQKRIPDIAIDGADFGMDGVTFRRLACTDIRGLFLGELTDCCQSIGNAGSDCAAHGFTSENGGFYVVETANGEIIGQSWAWRGVDGELCLDSLETLGGRIRDDQWASLLDSMAGKLAALEGSDITALHVGTGGRTPYSLADKFAEGLTVPVDYRGYRDLKQQLCVWAAPKPR